MATNGYSLLFLLNRYQLFIESPMGGKKAGAGKDKKKKPPKEKKESDGLPAVDKQFYELTINDLNNKLTRLRGHNNRIELQVEELETKLKQEQEQKADIVTYLNGLVTEKVDVIKDLEEKLTELNNVREDENRLSKKHYKDLEGKSKAIKEQLTSEIKLLTGKLNSLEEFRIQRDEILAKFEAQEAMLRDQTKKHEERLYEIEKGNIIGKDLLKKEVEQRLLKLSNDFTKSRDIRVASHVQRLVRENICLDNEIERMFVTHERLEKENVKLKLVAKECLKQQQVDKVENSRLIRTGQKQIQIIEALTAKVEEQLDCAEKLGRVSKAFEKLRSSLDVNESVKQLREEIAEMQNKMGHINRNRKNLRLAAIRNRKDLEQILEELKSFKHTFNEIILMDKTDAPPEVNRMRRENLLNELVKTLANIENTPIMSSVENILKINRIYNQGEIGFVPNYEVDQQDMVVTDLADLATVIARSREFGADGSIEEEGDEDESEVIEDPIIDVLPPSAEDDELQRKNSEDN